MRRPLSAQNLDVIGGYRTNDRIALYRTCFRFPVVVAFVGIRGRMDRAFSVSWRNNRRCDRVLSAFRHRAAKR